MRVLIFALILANLLFLVWTRGHFGAPAGGEAARAEQQLHPEKLTVVSRGRPPDTPASKQAAPATEQRVEQRTEQHTELLCQTWADLPNADADRLAVLLTEQFPAVKVVRRAVTESNGYWVFIPPSPTREAADEKVAELQRLGVQDYFVVQANGPNRLAISLGTYRTEEAAQAGLATLQRKGVKTAQLGERLSKIIASSLDVQGPAATFDALRQAVATLLPKATPTACPAPAKRASS